MNHLEIFYKNLYLEPEKLKFQEEIGALSKHLDDEKSYIKSMEMACAKKNEEFLEKKIKIGGRKVENKRRNWEIVKTS